jgi:hypothetical protein
VSLFNRNQGFQHQTHEGELEAEAVRKTGVVRKWRYFQYLVAGLVFLLLALVAITLVEHKTLAATIQNSKVCALKKTPVVAKPTPTPSRTGAVGPTIKLSSSLKTAPFGTPATLTAPGLHVPAGGLVVIRDFTTPNFIVKTCTTSTCKAEVHLSGTQTFQAEVYVNRKVVARSTLVTITWTKAAEPVATPTPSPTGGHPPSAPAPTPTPSKVHKVAAVPTPVPTPTPSAPPTPSPIPTPSPTPTPAPSPTPTPSPTPSPTPTPTPTPIPSPTPTPSPIPTPSPTPTPTPTPTPPPPPPLPLDLTVSTTSPSAGEPVNFVIGDGVAGNTYTLGDSLADGGGDTSDVGVCTVPSGQTSCAVDCIGPLTASTPWAFAATGPDGAVSNTVTVTWPSTPPPTLPLTLAASTTAPPAGTSAVFTISNAIGGTTYEVLTCNASTVSDGVSTPNPEGCNYFDAGGYTCAVLNGATTCVISNVTVPQGMGVGPTSAIWNFEATDVAGAVSNTISVNFVQPLDVEPELNVGSGTNPDTMTMIIWQYATAGVTYTFSESSVSAGPWTQATSYSADTCNPILSSSAVPECEMTASAPYADNGPGTEYFLLTGSDGSMWTGSITWG